MYNKTVSQVASLVKRVPTPRPHPSYVGEAPRHLLGEASRLGVHAIDQLRRLLTIVFFSGFFLVGVASAQPVFPSSGACDTSFVPSPFDRVVLLLCEVHDIIVALTVIFGAVMLAWAAYKFIRGDIEQAKQLITYTAAGVVLAILSKELVMWAVRLLTDSGGS